MTKIMGHRGAKSECIENTMEAFKKAVELDACGIETDVHFLYDGSLVMYHDTVIKAIGQSIYKFDGKTYNIKAEFVGAATLEVRDTGNKDTKLFVADWMYDDGNLYIYNIQFNTKDYKAFKENYAEYVTLYKEKV